MGPFRLLTAKSSRKLLEPPLNSNLTSGRDLARTQRIYLDYNAGAPLLPSAREALLSALGSVNPSSVHQEGRAARRLVEDARASVAVLVGWGPAGVTFTSGASEAAATALSPVWLCGARERAIMHLAVLSTDHPCLLAGGRFDREAISTLRVDSEGRLDPAALADWQAFVGNEPALLALGVVNSETGTVQPPEILAALAASPNITIVLDASQAAGRIDLHAYAPMADAMILSGPKIGAAQGTGALLLRQPESRPMPLVSGGGQEAYRRAGTEAVAAIASLGAAARVAVADRVAETTRLRDLQALLEVKLSVAGALILGAGAERAANTTLVAHSAVMAETAQIAFDLQGIAVSSGSACSSGKVGPSHVLMALAASGASVDAANGAVRISTGPATTADDIVAFVDAYLALVARVGDAVRHVA